MYELANTNDLLKGPKDPEFFRNAELFIYATSSVMSYEEMVTDIFDDDFLFYDFLFDDGVFDEISVIEECKSSSSDSMSCIVGNEHLKFYPRKIIPVVKHNDIRRSFLPSFESALNRCDLESLSQFMSTQCHDYCGFTFQHPFGKKKSFFTASESLLSSHESACTFIVHQLSLIPDSVILFYNVRLSVAADDGCVVTCSYSLKGTYLDHCDDKSNTSDAHISNFSLQQSKLLAKDIEQFHSIYSNMSGCLYNDEEDLKWNQRLEGKCLKDMGLIAKSRQLSLPPCGLPQSLAFVAAQGYNKYDRRNKIRMCALGEFADYLRDRSSSESSIATAADAAVSGVKDKIATKVGRKRARKNKPTRGCDDDPWTTYMNSNATDGNTQLNNNNLKRIRSNSTSGTNVMSSTTMSIKTTRPTSHVSLSAVEEGFWLLSPPHIVDIRGIVSMHISKDNKILKLVMRGCEQVVCASDNTTVTSAEDK